MSDALQSTQQILNSAQEAMNRAKLKLAINRWLSKGFGSRYLASVAACFSGMVTRPVFDEVIAEMEKEGLLRKMKGPNGGIMLVHCVNGIPLNPPDVVSQ